MLPVAKTSGFNGCCGLVAKMDISGKCWGSLQPVGHVKGGFFVYPVLVSGGIGSGHAQEIFHCIALHGLEN